MAMSGKDFGICEGEKAVDLPQQPDAGLYFIGRIHTPWKERKDCPKNARESEAVCTVEVDPRWREASRTSRPAAICRALLDGPIRREIWCCRCPAITASSTAPLPCARRPGPIPIAMSVVKLLQCRWQPALGGRPRLPGRHAADRHQALFRLHRQRAGGGGGLAQAERC